MHKRPYLILFFVIPVLVYASGTHAQNTLADTDTKTPTEETKGSLNNAGERRILQPEFLLSLPEHIWKKLRTQVKRFHSMDPEKQRVLCEKFEKDRGYRPPACERLFIN